MAVPATPPAAYTILEPAAATIRQIPPLAHPPPQTSLRTDTSPTSGSPTSPSRSSGVVLLASQSETSAHQKDRRATAILQLTAFVQNWPMAFTLAQLCINERHQMDFMQLHTSVRAAVSHKATNTIVRRLSSLTSYARWHRLHQSEPFPPQERDLWHYLQDDTVNTGHTVASSLLEAMHWAHGVLGLILQPSISTSPRLKGLVQGQSVEAPPVRRAPALPVTVIQHLEEITTTSPPRPHHSRRHPIRHFQLRSSKRSRQSHQPTH